MLVAATLASLVASCNDGTAPVDQRPASELTFLRPAPGAPEFADTTVSFWAKRGDDREVRVRYAPLPGSTETEEFLRFKVPAEALARYPDGRPVALGDSVLITVRIADFSRMIVDFQPSGLGFSAAHPARLHIEYDHADDDLDGDGDVDGDDERSETLLALWRQEAPGQPWFRVTTSQLEIDLDSVEADITSFSGYALAY
jgi:hypothetical protein